MKQDERNFLDELQRRTSDARRTHSPIPYPRVVARALGMDEKRAVYVCEKWASRGWYEYGTHALSGWVTVVGMQA